MVRSQDTKKTLTAYFTEVRAGKYQSIPKNLFQPENAKTTLSLLSPYLKDSAAVVRAKAYAIVQLAGGTVRQDNLREDAVVKLVEGIKDRDSGNAGQALGYLTGFRKEDFTTVTKDTLLALLRRKTPHYDELIRLIGFLEIKQAQNDLRVLSQQSTALKKDRWSALLALARMDDSYAIESVMTRVKKLPVNDEVVYEIFPDLVYTRQRAVYDLLIEALNNDAKNCESANAEYDAKIPCAYRVMEMLAIAVANYPLTLDASGDINTKDYKAALTTVREWFKKNKEYTILKSNY
ncbi:hypothetical protein [Ohtaekwangia koreensis]|uniref:hypothetical protein n=1 Tax=Ohtaekwangia koreensis TaxID=688867 RepID=UPI00117DA4F0|nr:hypothetical protein [Ohtaekwangia koreensis]